MSDKYIPEEWTVRKDDIYAAIDALRIARIYVKYSVEHNPRFNQIKINDLRLVDSAIDKLNGYPQRAANE